MKKHIKKYLEIFLKYIMNNLQESRLNRGIKQDLYLLNKKKTEETFIFDVAGSTANLYVITIVDNTITCNCPDMKRAHYRYICKHCCFVLLKVLKLELEDEFYKKFIFDEKRMKNVNDKFTEIIMKNAEYIDKDLIEKYNLSTEDGKSIDFTQNRETGDEDMCIICFSDFDHNNNIQCPICRNIIHEDCMKKWLSTGASNCIYCRSSIWKKYKKKGEKKIESEYKNLNDL